ncbi:MAG TPA: hypothetical protein ENN85_06125 [Methanoculleus sp.]|nr:hypothetical protein [Methanomicrobiaceae archaeon]HDR73469.1 hypothetical protein [Methanoculleus sp.]
MSRVLRIHDDAVETALDYGPTVSEGIRTMHALLQRQTRCAFDLEAVRSVVRDELERLQGY